MKGRYNEFECMVKRKYVLQSHSTDTTGAMGEKIVPEIRLCMEFLDFDAAHREQNSQTGKRRRKNAMICMIMEKREPVGTDGDAKPFPKLELKMISS